MLTSQKGTTLLELVMVMVLVGILAGFVSNMLSYEIDTYSFIITRKEVLQQSRLALQMISRDIRQISAPDSIFQASDDSLRFSDINNVLINYSFINNQISRNGDLLVNSINAFEFNYYDDSGGLLSVPVVNTSDIRSITFNLTTLINGNTLAVQTKVTPRNFND